VGALDRVLCAVMLKTTARFHRQYTRYVSDEVTQTLSYDAIVGGGDGGLDLQSVRLHLDTLFQRFARKYMTEEGEESYGSDAASGDAWSAWFELLAPSPHLFPAVYGTADALYTQHASGVWYAKMVDVIWKLVYMHYGGMEQQLSTLRENHEKVQQVASAAAAAHQASVGALTRQHAEELGRAQALFAASVTELTEARDAKAGQVTELHAKLDELGVSLVAMSTDRATRVAASEQETVREKLRADTAELEIVHLKDDIEELTEETSMVMEQTRKMSELTLDRDRARADLVDARRMLVLEQGTVKRLASEPKRESKEIQEQLLNTLKTMKDRKKVEHAQLKSARDEAQHKCAVLEGTVRVVNEELGTLRAQQAASLEAHESTVRVMRAQMEENEVRLGSSLRDVGIKLQDSERAVKEKEKFLEELTEKARDERVRYEQEKVAQLEEWKRRAVNAEDELRDQCARTANANERASRKRVRVDDPDKMMQLVRVEVELSNLRQEKVDLKAQLIDVQGQNRDQQQTIWSLQRGMDNQLTRLNIEHEARVTQLETQNATLEHKLSLAAQGSGAGGVGLSPRG
jgi:hypothetical protein